MPVTSTSLLVDWLVNLGGALWMGSRRTPVMGPASSTGSPVTFKIRPRQPSPTGTEIGAPVLSTLLPRTRPSVLSMAMARTVFSPMCRETSKVRLLSPGPMVGLVVLSAVRIGGREPSPSKEISTTGPSTWAIFPYLLSAMLSPEFLYVLTDGLTVEGFRAGDDFDEFLGDRGLTGAVHLQGER